MTRLEKTMNEVHVGTTGMSLAVLGALGRCRSAAARRGLVELLYHMDRVLGCAKGFIRSERALKIAEVTADQSESETPAPVETAVG